MGKSIGRVMLVLFVSGACANSAAPGDLMLERSRVLAVLGGSEPLGLDLTLELPVIPHIGREDALAIRLKLVVLVDDPDKMWRVTLTDQAGVGVWEKHSVDVKESVIWTPEIKGKRVTLRLFGEPVDNPVHLRVDRLAFLRPPTAPQAIVGANDIRSIANFSDEVKKLGESVAQIKFLGDDGKIYNCTGYLISAEHLLTNQHCISSDSERQSALVAFDYDHKTANTQLVELSELVRSSFALDYSVLRLAQRMTRAPLKASTGALSEGALLYIVQHPNAQPKRVSRKDCSVDEVMVQGRGELVSDFSHRCDTLGGSSGAPVVALDTHEVVGLHHLGFDAESEQRLNRAVHIGKVYADFPPDLLEVEE